MRLLTTSNYKFQLTAVDKIVISSEPLFRPGGHRSKGLNDGQVDVPHHHAHVQLGLLPALLRVLLVGCEAEEQEGYVIGVGYVLKESPR